MKGTCAMGLFWLNHGFICKELYGPFVLEKDNEYYKNLSQKYSVIKKQAEVANADADSIRIIEKYKSKILEALRAYYKADIAKSNRIIENLIKDVGTNPFAVNTLENSYAFSGPHDKELQLFRCRLGDPSKSFSANEMLFLPEELRAKSGNYRFSIPGNPSFYLANSSYGCWIETGFPADINFNVSPVILDGQLRIFNLAVRIRDFTKLGDFQEERVHCWLKLYMLSIATSYRIKEKERTFKSEYIVSQSIMMACKKLGYDGLAYYSKRVDDEVFALCAINLALFVDYTKKPFLKDRIKMDDSFSFAVFKHLNASLKYKEYDLRSVGTGFITNIGSYSRQYPYRETDFYEFDKFLFTTWRDRTDSKKKDEIAFGQF